MNRLKELRKAKKLTQKELADKIDTTKLTISNWENEKHVIKSDKAQILADFFGVSAGYLLGYSDNPKQYDDEKVNTHYDGTLWVYSEERSKEEDLQVFVKCLKELRILISDDQIKAIFELLQSMNVNNEGNYWGDLMSYDLLLTRDVDGFYDDMAKNGYSLLLD